MTPETTTVAVDETFLSLQGEGLEVGRAHLFLRLGGCPLRCTYCDTPRSWSPTETRSISELEAELDGLLAKANLQRSDLMLSVTGGEPLQQTDFLCAWLPTWGGPVLLETAGILAAELQRVLPFVQLLSLDWKLPSEIRQGQELLQPAECLMAARHSGVAVQIKLVVTETTTALELEDVLHQVEHLAPHSSVFLQPVTPFGAGPKPPTGQQLVDWSVAFARFNLDLRVLPQMHPVLGIR
ncbi:MAG: 7-carboxy-7-deazaguanine synthase QueE [Planctomycetes bacterium]|nr:7-carboxy-7-deazaguanine synthase QueE [Planctomycetota bacterium]MCP4861402.1 7-carboxy-7-deazaguanine synthase QueE [Planctomycetota bacterium]